jgi:hypothetical protein
MYQREEDEKPSNPVAHRTMTRRVFDMAPVALSRFNCLTAAAAAAAASSSSSSSSRSADAAPVSKKNQISALEYHAEVWFAM